MTDDRQKRVDGRRPCPELDRLAADVAEIVEHACPGCHGTAETCLVKQLRNTTSWKIHDDHG